MLLLQDEMADQLHLKMAVYLPKIQMISSLALKKNIYIPKLGLQTNLFGAK